MHSWHYLSSLFHGLVVSCILLTVSAYEAPVARLAQGTFQGAYSDAYNITYFQKIPFASPPVGDNRFRAPQPVSKLRNGTVYNSSQAFDPCPQGKNGGGSEDCLYLGLYSKPWTKSQELRPVVVTFYGGAFIQGSASFSIPPSAYPILNVSTDANVIFVYPNYRVNAFGFLPGSEIRDDPKSDFNTGLLDQHAALQWVHDNIRAFGGDPSKVTVWGQSAGAGSVIAQSIASQARQSSLFSAALASSPFWPKTYDATSREAETIFEAFAFAANCTAAPYLPCLKTASVDVLRQAALSVAALRTYTTSSYTWAPVIDGSFLPNSLTKATKPGTPKITPTRVWGMYNLHEGENFIPTFGPESNTSAPPDSKSSFNSTQASFHQWLAGFLPYLSSRQLSRLEKLYPASGSAELLPSYNTTFVRAGLVYRDVVLACPALWLAVSADQLEYDSGSHNKDTPASTPKGWVGEYGISPATHAADTVWWNQINAIQTEQPDVYHGYAGAMANFFQFGDPEGREDESGTKVDLRGDTGGAMHPRAKDGSQWTLDESGEGSEKIDGPKGLRARCMFWRDVAGDVPI